jgi:pimeloyl-ACP methyl ester carboxylesterase
MTAGDTREVDLHHDVGGDGEPLVLVHGAWADGRHWGRLVAELHGFRTVSYDRRGHGRSGGSHTGIAADVDDLAAIVERTGAAPAHIVAGSFGGSIALRLAAARPDLFRSLSVHEPALPGLLGGRGGGAGGPLLDLLDAGDVETAAERFADASLGDGAWNGLTAAERDGFLDNAQAWRDETADAGAFSIDPDPLRAFDRPALISIGGESPDFFRRIADALDAVLPHAEIGTVPGAGHLPHLTHPREYAALVRSFATSAAAPRRSGRP